MKIQISKNEESQVEGYEQVLVSDNNLNLDHLSDNECSFILANEILDSFSLDRILGLMKILVGKLRLNGTLVVGGTDLRLFCKSVTNQSMSFIDASDMIAVSQSMTSLAEVKKVVESMGLSVVSTNISGIHFELTTKRTK